MAARKPTDKHVRTSVDSVDPRQDRGDEPRPLLQSVDRAHAAEELAAALRTEVEELNDRAERLRGRVVASEREAVLLSEHLATKSTLAGELRAETSVLRRELDATRRDLDAVGQQRSTVSDQLDALRAQLDERVAELATSRSAQASLETELGQARTRVEDLEFRVRSIDDYRAALDAAYASSEALAEELSTQVAAVTAVSVDLDDAQAEIARLASELAAAPTPDDLERLEADHRQRQEALRAEVERAQAQSSAAHSTVLGLEARLDVSDAGRLEAQELGEALEQQLATQQELAAAREQELVRQGELAAALEQQLAGQRGSAAAQEAQLAAQRELVDAREQELVRQGELADAQAQLLAATEVTRDRYAHIVKGTAPTALGRLAYRWRRFIERKPRAGRLVRAPFETAWKVLTLRWPSWLRQHPLFDEDYYREANRDIAGGRLKPWWHYVRHGAAEGRGPNRYFDRSWYLRTYPDVAVAGLDPLEHYYRRGCWEGRDPSPRFVTDWYLAQHTEVAAAGTCALDHFLRVGVAAGFAPSPAPSGHLPASGTAGVPTPSTTPPRGAHDSRVMRPESAPTVPIPVAAVSPVRPDVKAIGRLVAERVPHDARLGVISDGSDELLKLAGPVVSPVPRGADGGRAADVPRNKISAIAHLEALRATHIDFVLAPDPCLWLTAVPGLVEYLDGRYERLGRAGVAFLWDVRKPDRRSGDRSDSIDDALRDLRDRIGSEPSVLDWHSSLDVSALLSGAAVFAPPSASTASLAYADSSIDAVVIPAGSGRGDEARRVARSLVIEAALDPVGASIEWLRDGSNDTASVSVIIPTYADSEMVSACLRTLEETTPQRLDVEFIVADDGSDEEIVVELGRLVDTYPRARLVHNETNGGYIAAATAGAAAAGHDILVFLNNDTVLLPGWLEPLTETFTRNPEAGVVGGMLLYPDGRLQEAGCAIFADGSATKIGYGDSDPSLPYYAHPREVDYVSGALLATPRALFEELGGFDEDYGFGYYEDGDYCFKAREAGRTVSYQPLSRIVHLEGGTAGLDVTQGAKAFQARNQAIFIERWRDALGRLPVRPEPLDLYASRDLVVKGQADHPAR